MPMPLLIIHLSGHGGGAPELGKLIDVGLPTVLFSQPLQRPRMDVFSLSGTSRGSGSFLLPSSDWSDLEKGGWPAPGRGLDAEDADFWPSAGRTERKPPVSAELVKKKLGAGPWSPFPTKRVMQLFNAIDRKAAEAEAQEYWISKAAEIVEPSEPGDRRLRAECTWRSRKLMIPGEGPGRLQRPTAWAPPRGCLTFSKLNDLGLVGRLRGGTLTRRSRCSSAPTPSASPGFHHRPGDRHGQETP
jgi:hypothetical protein